MARGDGRIYLRGSVYWACYYLRGVQYRESTKETDQKKAEKFLQDRRDERGADKIGTKPFVTPKAKRITVAQLCQSLRAKYELHDKASKQNLCHLARAEKDFGHFRAMALDSDYIDEYIKERIENGDAKATVNRTTGMLLQAYEFAIEDKKLSQRPRITHLSEKGNTRKGFLKPEQFEKLCGLIPADLKDFVEWGYRTGQRKGETAGMTWNMLDGSVLRIPGDIVKNRDDRTLPLSTELLAIIERRKAARRVEENGTVRMAEFIFHRDGRPVGCFKKAWKTACRKADVPGTLYHDLRRSFVKNGTDAGVRTSLLMRAGGWATESMIKRHQISVDEEVRAAMEQTEKHLTEKAKARAQAGNNVVAMQR
jgi:integrase